MEAAIRTVKHVLEGKDLTPLFDAIINHFEPQEVDEEGPFQMLVSSIDYNEYVGRIGIGRIERGKVAINQEVQTCNYNITGKEVKLFRPPYGDYNDTLISVCDSLNLKKWKLSGADLSGADLREAYLRGAHLSGANLFGAHLSGANLSGADLSRAKLINATLFGANLIGADLSGAKYCLDKRCETIFPDGFNPEKHGMIEVDILGRPIKKSETENNDTVKESADRLVHRFMDLGFVLSAQQQLEHFNKIAFTITPEYCLSLWKDLWAENQIALQ